MHKRISSHADARMHREGCTHIHTCEHTYTNSTVLDSAMCSLVHAAGGGSAYTPGRLTPDGLEVGSEWSAPPPASKNFDIFSNREGKCWSVHVC